MPRQLDAAPARVDAEAERGLQELIDTRLIDCIDLWRYSDRERCYRITNVTAAAGKTWQLPAAPAEQAMPWLAGRVQQHQHAA